MNEGQAGATLPEFVTRFSLQQRLEHLAVMACFAVLFPTGLSQKYYTSPWAQSIIAFFGGIEWTRLIHRGFGVALSAIVGYHIARVLYLVFTRRVQPSMVPTPKDAQDAILMLKYCFGLTEDQPRFGRFGYRQKWEYWAMFFNALIMMITGFILYYPITTTRLLPGQVVPVAKTVHSYEALLSLLIILIWHMYAAHLSPDTFPIDTTIFTGKISRERMLRDHPLEAELFPSGECSAPSERGLSPLADPGGG